MDDKNFKLRPHHLTCGSKSFFDGFRHYCEKCDTEFKDDEAGYDEREVKKMKELIDKGIIEIPPEERILPN